ncbi:hypothetical protein GOBAR_DD11391 [Gossypium barbadense]|nr:hypothetical protein GOBAR_DD11391 [Gossypium barbadense]
MSKDLSLLPQVAVANDTRIGLIGALGLMSTDREYGEVVDMKTPTSNALRPPQDMEGQRMVKKVSASIMEGGSTKKGEVCIGGKCKMLGAAALLDTFERKTECYFIMLAPRFNKKAVVIRNYQESLSVKNCKRLLEIFRNDA